MRVAGWCFILITCAPVLAGCKSELVRPETARRHEPFEALAALRTLLPTHEYAYVEKAGFRCGRKYGASVAVVDGGGVTFTCNGASPVRVGWSEFSAAHANMAAAIQWENCEIYALGPDGTRQVYLDLPYVEESCRTTAESLLSLSQLGPSSFLIEPGFDAVAAQYLSTTPRPTIGEDVRRHSVQAEAAVRNKDLIAAARAYGEALKVAPWWPQGRFNRALIMGELGFAPEAIQEMQRYLQLVPDAANARQAQDKIYQWEALPKR